MSKVSFFCLFPLFCLCLTTANFAQSRLNIRVSAESSIDDEYVNLGEIAQISGNEEKIERLKLISLGYAPNVGMMKEISREQIALAISAAGFSESEIVLTSPETILVRRAGQEISANRIREAVENVVLKQYSPDTVSARIADMDIPKKIEVPLGKLEIRVNMSGSRNLFARFSLPVEILVDEKIVRRFAVTLEVEAFAKIFVAAKDLAANSQISAADIRLEKRKLEKPLENYLLSVDQLPGLKLLKNIGEGQELTSDALAAGIVVKPGDPVLIEARSENFKITISGEARSSGKIGDRIAVKNSQSGAIIQTTVIKEGLVKIAF